MATAPFKDSATKKRKVINLILRLIGLIIFIWIISRVDLYAIYRTLRSANSVYVAIGILMAIPTLLLRSGRLRMILRSFGILLSLAQTLLIRIVGSAAGDMFPGRTGELVTVAYLQQAGHGLRDPTLALVLDRLFDFIILTIVSIIGFIVIGQQLMIDTRALVWVFVLAVSLFGVMIIILLQLRARISESENILLRFIPTRWQTSIQTLVSGGFIEVFDWNILLIFKIFMASFFSYLLLVTRGYFLAISIGINLSLTFLAISMAITTILQLIPISNVLGIGTREVSLVFLFGLAGITAEQAVSFSFLIVLALVIQDIFGLILWWRYPVGTQALKSIDYENSDEHSKAISQEVH